MKLAKADLVPKDTNLLGEYASFAALEAACEVFCGQVNGRVHRVTRRVPAGMLAEERARLHPLPEVPHTVAFGLTRTVAARTPMVAFEGGPPVLGALAAARAAGLGPRPRHRRGRAGDHRPRRRRRPRRGGPPCPRGAGQPAAGRQAFPAGPAGALARAPKARTAAEAAEFLALGNGARLWLAGAAAAGTARMRRKMAAAVTTARLASAAEVDRALGHAALSARFGEGDLASILDHHARGIPGPDSRAREDRSLAQGTARWAALGAAADGEVTA